MATGSTIEGMAARKAKATKSGSSQLHWVGRRCEEGSTVATSGEGGGGLGKRGMEMEGPDRGRGAWGWQHGRDLSPGSPALSRGEQSLEKERGRIGGAQMQRDQMGQEGIMGWQRPHPGKPTPQRSKTKPGEGGGVSSADGELLPRTRQEAQDFPRKGHPNTKIGEGGANPHDRGKFCRVVGAGGPPKPRKASICTIMIGSVDRAREEGRREQDGGWRGGWGGGVPSSAQGRRNWEGAPLPCHHLQRREGD